MREFENSIIPMIEANVDNFTSLEKKIAQFFIDNKKELDFSTKNIASLLYVSEAALSRFAQKMGFPGYREFIFQYKSTYAKDTVGVEDYVDEALKTYEELLNKSYNLIDGEQIKRVAKLFSEKKRIYVYGMGSSGLAAKEFQTRFMRLGVDVEAITDAHLLTVNSVRTNEDCIVIGITISRSTKEVLEGMKKAKSNGATTILITSKKENDASEAFDEEILVSMRKNLEYGNIISPQFPILIIIDILYASYIREDKKNREETYDSTLHAILDSKSK